jgi:predicted ATPase
MVELAPVADPDMVIAALASTMSIQPQPGMSLVESIVDWCLGRRMLLIIDNCEHVLEPVVEVVTAIVAGCPTVTIIATSREPLGVDGERVNRIPSLEESFAVELFCDRARGADGNFAVAGNDVEVIAAICVRVDGIPLAIELAAARIRSLSPQELLDRLDDRFRLLRGGGRGGLERHQTLRAAVAWSYQLLSEPEQLLFDRLTVFAGGFDLDAAESVCGGDGIDEFDVIDLIGELVDKSMVVAERTGSTTRYRMLETLRQYGEERLDDRGETAAVRDRHLSYYLDVVARVDDLFGSPGELEGSALGDLEWANFRAGHEWAITTGDFARSTSIVGGLFVYAHNQVRHEAQEWIAATLQLGQTNGIEDASLYAHASAWAFLDGDMAQTLELAERGLAVGGSDDQSTAVARTFELFGLVGSGRIDEATALFPETVELISRTESAWGRLWLWLAVIDTQLSTAHIEDDVSELLKVADEIGGPTARALGQRVLGRVRLFKDPPDIDGAITAFQSAISLADTSGSQHEGSWARFFLAFAMVLDDPAEAATATCDTIAYANNARLVTALLTSLEIAVFHLVACFQLESAATILGYLEQKPPAFAGTAVLRDRNLAAVGDLTDFNKLKADGAAMGRQEIVDYALAQLDNK